MREVKSSEKRREYFQKYYQEHRGEIDARAKEWAKNNSARAKEIQYASHARHFARTSTSIDDLEELRDMIDARMGSLKVGD